MSYIETIKICNRELSAMRSYKEREAKLRNKQNLAHEMLYRYKNSRDPDSTMVKAIAEYLEEVIKYMINLYEERKENAFNKLSEFIEIEERSIDPEITSNLEKHGVDYIAKIQTCNRELKSLKLYKERDMLLHDKDDLVREMLERYRDDPDVTMLKAVGTYLEDIVDFMVNTYQSRKNKALDKLQEYIEVEKRGIDGRDILDSE